MSRSVSTPPATLEQLVEMHRQSDERLIWCGRPRIGVVFRVSDLALIPFSIVACSFLIVWAYMCVTQAPWPVKVVSIFGIGFAYYLAIGRFQLDMLRRKNTVFAVTDERSLWIDERKQTLDLALPHSPDRSLSLLRAGSYGTIVFGAKNNLSFNYGRAMGIGRINDSSPEFEYLENGEAVFDLLRELCNPQVAHKFTGDQPPNLANPYAPPVS